MAFIKPKTATVDLMVRPPLSARRVCLPIAAQKTCGNWSAGEILAHRTRTLPFVRRHYARVGDSSCELHAGSIEAAVRKFG
jgi:hypothetical protein